MLKKIDIRNLKKNMFVSGVEDDIDHDKELYTKEGFIKHDDIGMILYNQGYRWCYIYTNFSNLPPNNNELENNSAQQHYKEQTSLVLKPSTPSIPFHEELSQALNIRETGMTLAQKIFQNRPAVELPFGDIERFVSDMETSLSRNSNAMLCLSKLRKEDDYTFSHSLNVALFAILLGEQLGLERKLLQDLACAGFLHDIGKMFVARQALNFPGKLSPSQMKEVRSHVLRGYDYLRRQPGISDVVLNGELDHQERYDGSGYPHAKTGEEISLAGRILAVVDAYDALSSARCYKPAMLPSKALSLLYQERERSFTPGYVETFIQSVGVYPPGSWVRLSDHRLALVMEVNMQDRLRPGVTAVTDNTGTPCPPHIIDLEKHEELSILGTVQRVPQACLSHAMSLLRQAK